MPSYLYAAAMLAATIAGFIVLAKLLQALRTGTLAATLVAPWQGGARRADDATRTRLTIEQSCAVDGKRRLLLVRCEEQRVLLLTGGPADLVVCVLPAPQAGGAVS